MLERTLVQSSGFRNIQRDGQIVGFELRVRLPSYRGLRLSLIDGVSVKVNDELFEYECNRIALHGREYALDQLREETTDRWAIDEVATVRVDKPGGLPAGVHKVEVGIRIRQSYVPIEYQPTVIWETRHATIVE